MQGQRGSQVGRGALLGESAKVRIQERKCRGAHASPSLCPASPRPSLENARMKEEGEVGLEQLVCMPGTHRRGRLVRWARRGEGLLPVPTTAKQKLPPTLLQTSTEKKQGNNSGVERIY